jgi:hypothetical protein
MLRSPLLAPLMSGPQGAEIEKKLNLPASAGT